MNLGMNKVNIDELVIFHKLFVYFNTFSNPIFKNSTSDNGFCKTNKTISYKIY